MNTENQKYNGWANYETWNVVLWIGNDERLYQLAKDARDYSVFLHDLKFNRHRFGSELVKMTPDQVSWDSPKLDIAAINQFIGEV